MKGQAYDTDTSTSTQVALSILITFPFTSLNSTGCKGYSDNLNRACENKLELGKETDRWFGFSITMVLHYERYKL